MKQFTLTNFSLVLFLGVFLISCNPEPDPITGEALFTYEVDGLKVNFSNTSTVSGTSTYVWDFGDDESSADENPVHTYAKKGEYTVELIATDDQDGTHTVSTKITVDKSSPVVLGDDSFDDWGSIAEGFDITDDAGTIKSFKYDFDSEFIYFYIKQEVGFVDASIFDMLIDVDPDETTGYTYGRWPLFGGAELLIENSLSHDKENVDLFWLDYANYDEAGTDWDTKWIYDSGATADTQVDGTYKITGSVVEMEFALSRNNIPLLKDVEVIKVCAWTSNQDWDEIGWMPNTATTENPDTDGITIDMR